MFDFFRRDGRPNLVVTVTKVTLAVGFLSLLATNWLSRNGLDQIGLSRLTAQAYDEPMTTGTLARAANQQKLDPCAVPRRP